MVYFSNCRISNEQAAALCKYVGLIKALPGKKIFRLILDACSLTDESFDHILNGIMIQSITDKLGNIRVQYL